MVCKIIERENYNITYAKSDNKIAHQTKKSGVALMQLSLTFH